MIVSVREALSMREGRKIRVLTPVLSWLQVAAANPLTSARIFTCWGQGLRRVLSASNCSSSLSSWIENSGFGNSLKNLWGNKLPNCSGVPVPTIHKHCWRSLHQQATVQPSRGSHSLLLPLEILLICSKFSEWEIWSLVFNLNLNLLPAENNSPGVSKSLPPWSILICKSFNLPIIQYGHVTTVVV